jgi:hypothetical protein
VDQFVIMGNIQRRLGLAEDRVSEGDGKSAFAQGQMSHQPADRAAVEFDDSIAHPAPAAAAQPQTAQSQAKERIRGGPEDT